MKSVDQLKREWKKAEKLSSIFQISTLVFLVVSFPVFTLLGDETSKNIIWYWAGFMAVLVITSLVFSIIDIHKMTKYFKGIDEKFKKDWEELNGRN